jgi:hypothetical protein
MHISELRGAVRSVLLRTLTGDFDESAIHPVPTLPPTTMTLQRLAACLAHQQQKRNQD